MNSVKVTGRVNSSHRSNYCPSPEPPTAPIPAASTLLSYGAPYSGSGYACDASTIILSHLTVQLLAIIILRLNLVCAPLDLQYSLYSRPRFQQSPESLQERSLKQ